MDKKAAIITLIICSLIYTYIGISLVKAPRYPTTPWSGSYTAIVNLPTWIGGGK